MSSQDFRSQRVWSFLMSSQCTMELLDDDEHILGIKIIDGDHRLKNYSSILMVHPEIIEERSGTLVIESFVVDIPDGNTNDETCYFVKSLINCNLNSLLEVSERMVVQNQRENKHISRTISSLLLGEQTHQPHPFWKHQANIVAAFARTSREDSQKLLAPEYYPSWVAASKLIKANVKPVLDQYRPIVLSSLKFSKLTLGTVAPQFIAYVWQTLLSELSNEVGFPVTNTSIDALLESLLSTAKPFPQSAGYRILAS
ncbi:abscisic acid receptor PYL9 [Tanacetum coccineum]